MDEGNKAILVSLIKGYPVISVIDAPEKEDEYSAFLLHQLECLAYDVIRSNTYGFPVQFDAWVDDEGYFAKGNPLWVLKDADLNIEAAGKLIFSRGADTLGKTLWFTEESAKEVVNYLLKHLKLVGEVS